MRKLLVIVCCAAFLFLSGCYNESSDERMGQDERMSIVFNDGFAVIYRDNITGVQYFSRAGSGSCVMVDADGNPLVLKEGASDG